ncbi:ribonuclease HII [Jannaschia ovalis]|uniref:Ribonuclease HII n=1 Tax=Jannaschia ovalis TaxID=3038773 RepID=A0ABY8L6Z2_9RHOB|nr:ribonuclease HII [Jannaschia sp. GRR-S6-38]WGH77154.1 ribonuclease HII [Jannaschia sp. GRR-S6-38]
MPALPPDFSHERAALDRGARVVAGLDEVGRGPWAGPVVACAARLTGPAPAGLTDSKKLTAARRAALVPLLEACCEFGFGEASVAEIDALNIRRATHLAMRRAVAALPVPPDHLLIDGNDCPDWVDCPRDVIIGGDARSLSIAAASVLAKTRRDQGMVALAQQFPGYGWERNAGYGTAAHRAGLETLGVTQHHRRSFAPIRKILCPTA